MLLWLQAPAASVIPSHSPEIRCYMPQVVLLVSIHLLPLQRKSLLISHHLRFPDLIFLAFSGQGKPPQKARIFSVSVFRTLETLERKGNFERIAIAIPIHRSLHTPEPRNPRKVSKVFPGLPARSVKNVSKKSQSTRKRVKKGVKISVRGLFRHCFDTPGQEAREDLFLPRAICRSVLEDFCCINFGGFCR